MVWIALAEFAVIILLLAMLLGGIYVSIDQDNRIEQLEEQNAALKAPIAEQLHREFLKGARAAAMQGFLPH